MTALNTIEQIAGNLGWSLVWGAQMRMDSKKGKRERTFVEFHHLLTSSGDDFSFTIFYRIPVDIIRGVRSYAFNFDIDGYIDNTIDSYYGCDEMIPSIRNTMSSERVMINKAEEIDKILFNLSGALLDSFCAVCL